jgi:hypothetical protein
MKCDLFSKNIEWLLRDLDTREIVSSKVLAAKNVNLADALLMKICWTTIPSFGDEGFNVHRGEWAGHRFDIIAKDMHDEAGWRDESEKVANEASVLKMKVNLRKKSQRGWQGDDDCADDLICAD